LASGGWQNNIGDDRETEKSGQIENAIAPDKPVVAWRYRVTGASAGKKFQGAGGNNTEKHRFRRKKKKILLQHQASKLGGPREPKQLTYQLMALLKDT